MSEVQTDLQTGLTSQEAAARLLQNGPNEIVEKKRKSPVVMFLSQLNDPMIYVLFVAAALSIWRQEIGDAVIILAVVLLNAIIGMTQESKAEKSLEALKKLASPFALVKRDGKQMEVPARELVMGDLVILDAGRVVPADLQLTTAVNLRIEESALTGESVPVEKDAKFKSDSASGIGDRLDRAYSSTAVVYGRGEGLVTAAGMNTEIGRIAGMLSNTKSDMTPLQKRLADLGKLLGAAAVIICAALFGIGVWQQRDLTEMMMTAISLAVAAVPEGLPAVVTIVLALGVQRLVKVNTIVRRLPSVETLGAVNVVCTDKTGTLTVNRMTVTQVYRDGKAAAVSALDTEKDRLFLTGFVLCNDAVVSGDNRTGDPTELALLDMGIKLGITREGLEHDKPRVNERAFDSDRKMMTTVHKDPGGVTAFTKGAADQLLQNCTGIMDGGKQRPLTEADRRNIENAAGQMARSALRVLGMACRAGDGEATERDMVFVGLVGMIDPPRQEAKTSVAVLKAAGVRTVMITGDHRDTALAIARELGIAENESQCATGAELDQMTQDELNEKVDRLRVFARVSPQHKVAIVQALKWNGHIVSMTGDGVNDAPSLKAADIGVAMGITGTDVAKGASDMILTDDNFSTIEKAVAEGRGIYANIRKTVLFLLSSNFGEVITMFAAIALNLASPLRAIHILWVNLITDSLPGLALGMDVGDERALMKKPPRSPKEGLFSHGGLTLTLFYGALIAGITLSAFLFHAVADVGWHFAAVQEYLRDPENLRLSQTFAFVTLSVSQLFHALGMRNTGRSLFKMNWTTNKTMILAFTVGMVLQVAVTELPVLVNVFDTVQLSLVQWGQLLLFSLVPVVAHELIVLVRFIFNKQETADRTN